MPSQKENEENPMNYSQSFRKSMKQLKIALEFQPSALNTNPYLTCPFSFTRVPLLPRGISTTKAASHQYYPFYILFPRPF